MVVNWALAAVAATAVLAAGGQESNVDAMTLKRREYLVVLGDTILLSGMEWPKADHKAQISVHVSLYTDSVALHRFRGTKTVVLRLAAFC